MRFGAWVLMPLEGATASRQGRFGVLGSRIGHHLFFFRTCWLEH